MILSQAYLRSIAQKNNFRTDSAQSKILNENKAIRSAQTHYDLFVSHSYLDKVLVVTLVNLFNKAGYSVYVDWIVDSQLDRNSVNRKTASIIRQRMNRAKGLAYIATSNTTNSRWCPWELGYVDGKKGGMCTILPILKEPSSIFKGQEYLGLYPYLVYEKESESNRFNFWVEESSEVYIILSEWLNGSKPMRHNL